jgi:hypothetical protein
VLDGTGGVTMANDDGGGRVEVEEREECKDDVKLEFGVEFL